MKKLKGEQILKISHIISTGCAFCFWTGSKFFPEYYYDFTDDVGIFILSIIVMALAHCLGLTILFIFFSKDREILKELKSKRREGKEK